MADVRISPDSHELARRAAGAAAMILIEAARSSGRCSLVLSGGSTPRELYGIWSSSFADRVPWADVHVFWGDERWVAHDDPRSNYRMAKEALLDRVPCRASNLHPMPTAFPSPELAAQEYETVLTDYFARGPRRFDLVLLGLGPEGHTASLFPESPALDETTRWVVPVTVPADPPSRLTLTLPALNAAAHTYFLVTGREKADALARTLEERADVRRFPAAGIEPVGLQPVWWVDREAAALHRIEASRE